MDTPTTTRLQAVLQMRTLQQALRRLFQAHLDEKLSPHMQALANEFKMERRRFSRFISGGVPLVLRAADLETVQLFDRFARRALAAWQKHGSLKRGGKPVSFSPLEHRLLGSIEQFFITSALEPQEYAACRFPEFAITLAYELRAIRDQLDREEINNPLFASAFGEHRTVVEGLLALQHTGALEALVATSADEREEPSAISDALIAIITMANRDEVLNRRIDEALQSAKETFEEAAAAYEELFDTILAQTKIGTHKFCKEIGHSPSGRSYIRARDRRYASLAGVYETIRLLITYADERGIPVHPATRTLVGAADAPSPPVKATPPSPATAFPAGMTAPLHKAPTEAVVTEALYRLQQTDLADPFIGDLDAVTRHCLTVLEATLRLLQSRVQHAPLTHRPTQRELLRILFSLKDAVNPEHDSSLEEEAGRGPRFAASLQDLTNRRPRSR